MATKKRDRQPRPKNIGKCISCGLVVHDTGPKQGYKYFHLGMVHPGCHNKMRAAVDRFSEELKR